MDYGNERATRAAAAADLPNGRLISWSKSFYRRAHPDHLVAFNATIADDEGNGLWWGDIDATLDEGKLAELARSLDQALHVLYEGDTWRVGAATDAPFDVSGALVRVDRDGTVTVRDTPYRRRTVRNADGQLVWQLDDGRDEPIDEQPHTTEA